MVKFELVVKGVSVAALPIGSLKGDWWVWGMKQAAPFIDQKAIIGPFPFFL